MTPLKAIRLHCINCHAGERADVPGCFFPTCPLYPFRLGRNPNCRPRAGETTVPPHSVVKPVGILGEPVWQVAAAGARDWDLSVTFFADRGRRQTV